MCETIYNNDSCCNLDSYSSWQSFRNQQKLMAFYFPVLFIYKKKKNKPETFLCPYLLLLKINLYPKQEMKYHMISVNLSRPLPLIYTKNLLFSSRLNHCMASMHLPAKSKLYQIKATVICCCSIVIIRVIKNKLEYNEEPRKTHQL